MKLVILFSLVLSSVSSAQIFADFTVFQGGAEEHNFTVSLDYNQRPIATANFMLLSGLPEEKWQGPVASAVGNYTAVPGGTARPGFEVRAIPGTQDYRASIPGLNIGDIILKGNPNEMLFDDPANPRFRIEKEIINNIERFVLTLKYDHGWYDNRINLLKKTPLYQSHPFTNLEKGRRIFAGSFSAFSGDGPGYLIQDELLNSFSSAINPWGTPFSTGFVLAMDSFGPNSSGSRFFITAVPEGPNDDWTGNYTAFGIVTQDIGRQVVRDLVNAEGATPGSVLPGYTIKDIKFRITGPATQSFWPHLVQDRSIPKPPTISTTAVSLEIADDNALLTTRLLPGEQAAFLFSLDLRTNIGGLTYGTGNSGTMMQDVISTLAISPAIPRGFFKTLTTKNPRWPSGTELGNLNSKSLGFNELKKPPLTEPLREFRMNFNAAGTGGNLIFRGQSFPFDASYDPSTSPYVGIIRLENMPEELPLETIRLYFDSNAISSVTIRRFEATLPEEDLPIPDLPPGIPLPAGTYVPTFGGLWVEF